jgi:N-acetyl-1-D-myo-inositol-2-amino-2-deoxy-alpha-D-glucopyranoside deacetylase
MRGGLLVVVAHPDDEVLIAGGTLAACAAAGIPTAVVCLTRGEDGPISDPALATPQTLGAVRAQELMSACAELGVGWVKCYRRRDGYLRWSDGSAIVRQLEAIIRDHRPDGVITFGEDGLYYHPDHIAVFEYTLRAVRRAERPPEMYRAVWPEEMMSELAQELHRRSLPAGLWDLAPEDFGTEDTADAFALDVRAFTDRKLRALRAHRTQISAAHAFSALPEDLVGRYLGFEWFAPVTGAAGGDGWLRSVVGNG